VCPDPSLSALCARTGVAEVAFEEDGAEESRALVGGGAAVVDLGRLLDIRPISMVRELFVWRAWSREASEWGYNFFNEELQTFRYRCNPR